MSVTILREVSEGLGIRNAAFAIYTNVFHVPTAASAKDRTTALDERIKTTMERVHSEYKALLESSEPYSFRNWFVKMGYPKQVPAGERVFTSFAEKGFRNYGNIVDAYNMVAVSEVCSLGMHDAAKIFKTGEEEITLWRASGDERIVPSFQRKAKTVTKGDLVYGFKDTSQIFAWMGKKDVDSNDWKVTEKTKALFLTVLGNENTPEWYNQLICTKVLNELKLTCPDAEMRLLPVTVEGEVEGAAAAASSSSAAAAPSSSAAGAASAASYSASA